MDFRARTQRIKSHDKGINISLSTDDSEGFQKVEEIKVVTIGGSSAQILFKKPEAKSKSESKENFPDKNFITDGGLKIRGKKYYDSTTFNKSNAKQKPNTLYSSVDVLSLAKHRGNLSSGAIKANETEEIIVSKSKTEREQKQKSNRNKMGYKSKTDRRAHSVETRMTKKEEPKIKIIVESESKSINKSIKPHEASSTEMQIIVKENNYLHHTDKPINLQKSQKNIKKQQENSKDSENEDRPKKNTFLEDKPEKKLSKEKEVREVASHIQRKTPKMRSADPAIPKCGNMNLNSKSFSSNVNANSMGFSISGKVLTEQERIELMEKLVKNKEDEIIREVQKEVLKKGKQTNDRIQKKLKVLSEKNMLENIDFENRNEEGSGGLNEEQNNNIIDTNENNNNLAASKPSIPFSPKSTAKENALTLFDKKKPILKPKVDSFELMKKITRDTRLSITRSLCLSTNKFESSGKSCEKTNSFRRSNSEDKTFDRNYPYASKTNRRSQEEIYTYILQKREQEKEKAIKIEKEKNDDQLDQFIELAKLNEKIKINLSLDSKRKRKKEKNEYFIGQCRSGVSKCDISDDSTVIDPNDYYSAVLSSKKILTPVTASLRKYKGSSSKRVDSPITRCFVQKNSYDYSDKNVIKTKDKDNWVSKENFLEFLNNQELTIKSLQSRKSRESFEREGKDQSKKADALKKVKIISIDHNSNKVTTPKRKDLSSENFNKLKAKVLNTIQKATSLFGDTNISDMLKRSHKDSDGASARHITEQNEDMDKVNLTMSIKVNDSPKINEQECKEDNSRMPSSNENDIHNDTHPQEAEQKEQKADMSSSKLNLSNDNDNKVHIAPNAIEVMFEVIKFINRRRVFNSMIELYAESTLEQRFAVGIAYLVAIIKRGSFRALLDYGNYLTYYYSLNSLVAPIKRDAFYQITRYSVYIGKVNYLCELLLLLVKRKVLEYIYLASISKENMGEAALDLEIIADEEQNNLRDQYYSKCKGSFDILIRPHLIEAFSLFVSKVQKQHSLSEQRDNELNGSRKINAESPSSSKLWYSKNEDENFERNFSSNLNELPVGGANDAVNPVMNMNENHESENSISQFKMNTYIYESFSEKSIVLYPNSFDSHRLHKIHELIRKQQEDSLNNSHSAGECARSEGNINELNTRNRLNERSRSNSQNNSFENKKQLIVAPMPNRNETSTPNSNKSNKFNNVDYDINSDDVSNQKIPYEKDPDTVIFNDTDKNKIIDTPSQAINGKHDHETELPSEEINPMAHKYEKGKGNLNSGEQNNHYRRMEKFPTVSSQDISADRDLTPDIDWGYTVSGSKSSGSQRELHNLLNAAVNVSESPKQNLIDKDPLLEGIIIKEEGTDSEKSQEHQAQVDPHKEKANEDEIKTGYEHKESEEGKYDFNEFNVEDLSGLEDKEENILGIIRGESNSNNNLVIQNNKDPASQGLNSMKSRNQADKKRSDKDNSGIEEKEKDKDNASNIQAPAIIDPATLAQKVSHPSNRQEMNIGKDYEIIETNEEVAINLDIQYKDKQEDKYTIDVDKDGENLNLNLTPQTSKAIDKPGEHILTYIEKNSTTVDERSNEQTMINLNDKTSTSKIDDILKTNPTLKEFQQKSPCEEIPESKNKKMTMSLSDIEEKCRLSSIDYNLLADDITNFIVEDLLVSEIKNTKSFLIPRKSQKVNKEKDKDKDKMDTSLSLVNQSSSISGSPSHKAGGYVIHTAAVNINESALSVLSVVSSVNNSIFMRTISELRKESTLNLYNEKIAPKLIRKIAQTVETNYDSIYENIKTPLMNCPEDVLQSLVQRDSVLLKKSYKSLQSLENSSFLDKKKIMQEFDVINRDIRAEDNFTSDNYYDNILNECLIEAGNEILSKERMYGDLGEPLPWSNRTRTVKFKYQNGNASRNKIKETVENELTGMMNNKMGLIAENNEFLDPDQLNQEREKRLMGNITNELTESEEQWKVFEIEETQVKLELSDMVFEQLLNEVVEILEHVQLSRRRPNLYLYKSIYACEDIPRLSFQQYNTENDDNINQ